MIVEVEIHPVERDIIGASYRAGLCAGGNPVDWRGWLRDRVASWPDNPARTKVLAELQDPHVHKDWEMLPDYWCQ